MVYWLLVAKPENFEKCVKNGIWAVNDGALLSTIKLAKVGDEIYFHVQGMRAGGIFVVTKEYFKDETKVWDDDLYPNRIGIEPRIMPPSPVDIRQFFYQNFNVKPSGFFWKSMRTMPQNEFELFKEFIEKGYIDPLENINPEEIRAESTFSLSLERDLEEYLEKNLVSLEDGLRIYENDDSHGRQFNVSTGRIDLLALDKNSNIVVIELKAGEADISTFGQISAYMGSIQSSLSNGKKVRGIVVASSFDDKIKSAVLTNPSIILKRYIVSFKFRDE